MEERNNTKAFEYAKKFVDDELLVMFKQVEKRKGFGNLVHNPGGEVKADFIFNSGVCLRCVEPLRGNRNTFYTSTKFW